jgi:flagellar motor switch protein FliN/FliY
MAVLNSNELSDLVASLDSIRDSLALALSENINQAAMFSSPQAGMQSVDSVMGSASIVLQTVFSYPVLSPEEGVLVFSQLDAMTLADLIAGGSGLTPPTSLVEDQMTQLAEAMSGTLRGFGNALGSAMNLPIQPEHCTTTIELLTLPPGFALAGDVVQIDLPYEIPGVLQSMFQLYLMPDCARKMSFLAPPPEQVSPSSGFGAQMGNGNAGASIFQSFDAPSEEQDELPRGLELIMDIPLEVSVELGRKEMLIKDVLSLSAGSIIELERVAGEPVDLLVNGRLIAKGEVVVIEDNFGLRLTEIKSKADRVVSLKH